MSLDMPNVANTSTGTVLNSAVSSDRFQNLVASSANSTTAKTGAAATIRNDGGFVSPFKGTPQFIAVKSGATGQTVWVAYEVVGTKARFAQANGKVVELALPNKNRVVTFDALTAANRVSALVDSGKFSFQGLLNARGEIQGALRMQLGANSASTGTNWLSYLKQQPDTTANRMRIAAVEQVLSGRDPGAAVFSGSGSALVLLNSGGPAYRLGVIDGIQDALAKGVDVLSLQSLGTNKVNFLNGVRADIVKEAKAMGVDVGLAPTAQGGQVERYFSTTTADPVTAALYARGKSDAPAALLEIAGGSQAARSALFKGRPPTGNPTTTPPQRPSGGAHRPSGSGDRPPNTGKPPSLGRAPGGNGRPPTAGTKPPGATSEAPGGTGRAPGGSTQAPGGSAKSPGGAGPAPVGGVAVGTRRPVQLAGQLTSAVQEAGVPQASYGRQGALVRSMQLASNKTEQAAALAWADGAWALNSVMKQPETYKTLTQLRPGETVSLVRRINNQYDLTIAVTGTSMGGGKGGTLAVSVKSPWGLVTMHPTVGSRSGQPLEVQDTVKAAEAVRGQTQPPSKQPSNTKPVSPSGGEAATPSARQRQIVVDGEPVTVQQGSTPAATFSQGELVRQMQGTGAAKRPQREAALGWVDGAWYVNQRMKEPAVYKALTGLRAGESLGLVRPMGNGSGLKITVTGTAAGGKPGGTLAVTVHSPQGAVTLHPQVGTQRQPLAVDDSVKAAESVRQPKSKPTAPSAGAGPTRAVPPTASAPVAGSTAKPGKPLELPSQALSRVALWPSQKALVAATQAGDDKALRLAKVLSNVDTALRKKNVVAQGKTLNQILEGLQPGASATVGKVQFKLVANTKAGPVFEVGLPDQVGLAGVKITAKVDGAAGSGSAKHIVGLQLPAGLTTEKTDQSKAKPGNPAGDPATAPPRVKPGTNPSPSAEAKAPSAGTVASPETHPGIEKLPDELWKRLRDYGLGETTREDALKDLSPAQRKQLERALDELDKADAASPTPGSTPEVDKTRLGQIKALRRWQAMAEQQRAADYHAGRSTRDEALAGLTGKSKERVAAALDAIDRSRVGPGAGGTPSVQYDPLRLAEAINAHVKEYGPALGLSVAEQRAMQAALQRGLAAAPSADARAAMLKALAVLKRQSALEKTGAPGAADGPSSAQLSVAGDVSKLLRAGEANRQKNTQQILAAIALQNETRLDQLVAFVNAHAKEFPADAAAIKSAVDAQRAKLKQPVTAAQAQALLKQGFAKELVGLNNSQRNALINKVRLLADLGNAEKLFFASSDPVKSPKLNDFLFELGQIDTARAGRSLSSHVEQKLPALLGSKDDGRPVADSITNAGKQAALMEYMKAQFPDVVREIQQNISLRDYNLNSVVKLMHEYGGHDGQHGVQDLAQLGDNARREASFLAADRATAKPRYWREAFERYAKINPNNAAEIKELVSKSRYSTEDVVRAAVMYPNSGWQDPRAVAADMSKHTQAAKVERNRNIVGLVDVPMGPKWMADTDYFEGVPGDAKTRLHEMADKSGSDFVIATNPSQEQWLALADNLVRDNPPELLQIKALLIEAWHNGGKFNGPQWQISDVARIFKSKLAHSMGGAPTAAQILAEAKHLLQQVKAGKKLPTGQAPVNLNASDKLRAGVIDYRFAEAPLVARDSAATLEPNQRGVQLTQARLSALQQEGKLLLLHLQELSPRLTTQRSAAAAELNSLVSTLAQEQARVPSKTASNDPIVASWNAKILQTQLEINNIDLMLAFTQKAEQTLPTASPGDVKKLFSVYENLLNTSAVTTQATLAKIKRLLPLASSNEPLRTERDFILDPALQRDSAGQPQAVRIGQARTAVIRSARKAQLAQDGANATYGKGDNRRVEVNDKRRQVLQTWAQAAEKALRLGAEAIEFPTLGRGGDVPRLEP
jgi:hypothetical protein